MHIGEMRAMERKKKKKKRLLLESSNGEEDLHLTFNPDFSFAFKKTSYMCDFTEIDK